MFTVLKGLVFVLILPLAWGADQSRGAVFRTFLCSVVHSASQAPQDQPRLLRETFVKYPEVFKWLAEDQDFTHLFQEADLGAVTPKVMGEAEIAARIQQETKRSVQKWIKNPLFAKMAEDLVVTKIPNLAHGVTQRGAEQFVALSPVERMKLLGVIDDEAFVSVAAHVNSAIAETKISDSEAVKIMTRGEVFVMEGLPVTNEELSSYIGRYFDGLPLKNRQKMFEAFLQLPLGASLEEQVGAVLPNTGPGFKKMLQQFAGKTNSPILNKIAKKLQADNPSTFGADEILKEKFSPEEMALVESVDHTPLKAGTIGQVHAGKLKDGREVVFKIRHPGIVEEVRQEMEITRKVAQDTPFADLTDQIRESLMKETNFKIEATNMDDAERYNNPKKKIKIPGRIREFEIREDILVQEKASGTLMNKIERSLLLRRGRLLTDFLEAWFDRAMFDDGFFHSDPHPGNIIIERIKNEDPTLWEKIKLAFGVRPRKLLNQPIDYGNSGRLTLEQRRAFMQMAVGAAVGSPDQMVHGLSALSELTPEKQRAIVEAVKDVKWAQYSLSGRIQPVLTSGLKNGLFVPTDLLNFNRGKMLLEGELQEINKTLGRLDPEKKLERFYPQLTYAKVMSKRLGIEVPAQFLSKDLREKSIAPIDELFSSFVRGAAPGVDAYFFGLAGCLRRGLAKLWVKSP